jgi:prepilin-type N-terminal cleavage/methylation domain-containing protein
MKPRAHKPRRGLTLLELVIASSMLAILMTSVAVVLRTGRQAWEAHEADFSRLDALHATVRHIVRQVRQAKEITQISAANDNSGRLGVRMADGQEIVWDHNGSVVNCGVTNPDQLLATNIATLRFVGYKADGVTATTSTADIHNIFVEATTVLPNRDVGATKTASAWIWLRSW